MLFSHVIGFFQRKSFAMSRKNRNFATSMGKLNIINPIRKNAPFAFFMFALGVLAAYLTVLYKAKAVPYEHIWAETFFGVYIVCCVLSAIPWKRVRAVLRGIIYAIIYPLSVVDVYCAAKLDTVINPSILTLVTETDSREAGEFVQMYLTPDVLLSNVGIILLVPLAHILFTIFRKRIPHIPVDAIPQNRSSHFRLISNTICLGLLTYCAVVSVQNYRKLYTLMAQPTIGDVEHRLTEKDPGAQFLPLYRTVFSLNAARLTGKQLDVLKQVVADVRIDSCSVTSPNIVFIIGEAYNKQHSQLYGYEKPTTPRQLEMQKNGSLVSFNDVVSPWNLTSYVFKLMMSTYVVGDEGDWCDQPLIAAVFRKAGYHVTFITNEFLYQAKQAVYDFSGGFFLNDPQLSERQFDTRNTRLHVFDESLLAEYEAHKHEMYGQYADSIDCDPKPHLTILHMIGQHVNYRTRCPKKQKHFTKDDYSDRTDLSAKWRQDVADYDNATLYNDSVLGEIVKRFEDTNTIIIYMPDHGEEVHPKELPHFIGRMHSTEITPRLAREEFEIPFWIYATPKYQALHPEIWKQVNNSKSRKYMTDAMPHLLMYLAGIHCSYYRESLNVLSPQYNEARPRILKNQKSYDEVMRKQAEGTGR